MTILTYLSVFSFFFLKKKRYYNLMIFPLVWTFASSYGNLRLGLYVSETVLWFVLSCAAFGLLYFLNRGLVEYAEAEVSGLRSIKSISDSF